MSELGRETPGAEARARVEAVLAAIWEEVLRIEQVEVSDNFFALGGHSLTACEVASRVHERLGVKIPLREFITATTLKELAEVVVRYASTNDGEEVPGLFPPSPFSFEDFFRDPPGRDDVQGDESPSTASFQGPFQSDSLYVIADLDLVPTKLVAELMSDLNDLHRALGGGGLYVRSIETGSEAVAKEAFV
jgi:acyl carrier protein